MGLTKNLGWLSKYITADSSGNLGVGVASPLSGGGSAKWLTIDGTTYGGGFISSVNGVSKGTLYYDQASLTFSMYAPTGVGATIHTDGTERMRIFSSGNVFIGSSPTDSGYKLDVNGTGRFSGSISVGNAAIGLSGINLPDQNYLAWYASSGSGAQYVALRGNGSNLELSSGGGLTMTMDSAQRVGIGTAIPQTLTHLYTATARAIPALGSAGGHFMIQTGGVIATVMGVNANGNFYLQPQHINAGGSTVYNTLLNPSGGNVAVGINYSPTAKFHVEGQDIYLTGNTDNRIRFSNYGFTGNSMGAAIGYAYRVANTQESGGLVFYTNPNSVGPASLAESMRITPGGNILIGNTADTTALARSIVLDNGSNCGLVFKNAGNNKGYLYNSASNMYFETIGGTIYVMSGSAGVYLSNGATSWTANSDNRLKDINYTIENAVDKLCTLNAVSFSWKSDESKKEVLGLIAQDVEKVFPQIIDRNKLSRSVGDESEIDDTEYLGVRYQELIPVLVKAIQELTERIKTLENK